MKIRHFTGLNNLEKELNDVPHGEPVMLFHEVEDGDNYIILYHQPKNRIGVDIGVVGETSGDYIDLHQIGLIGFKDPVYHLRWIRSAELEQYRKPTGKMIFTTTDAFWRDDFILAYGRDALDSVVRRNSLTYLDEDYLPIISLFLEGRK